MGGGKAARALAGRPLAGYPAVALAAVCERVAIVAKPGEELPDLDGVERWDDEPAEPRHPLTGIVHALERAGEPVLVCAADMPFLTPEALRTLIAAGGSAPPPWPWRAACCSRCWPCTRPPRSTPCAPQSRTRRSRAPSRRSIPCGWRCRRRSCAASNTPEELAAAEAELSRAG